VDPRLVGEGGVTHSGKIVERTGVHVAGLGAHDGGSVRLRPEDPGQRLRIEGAVGIGGDGLDRTDPDPEQPERAIDRGMTFLAGHDPDPGGPDQASLLDVPPRPGQHPMARRGQGDGVGGLSSGH
jgi:hypothetical protein